MGSTHFYSSHVQSLNNYNHTAIDDPSVISTNERGRYGIYLSANEKIKLPFKYLKQWKEKSASSGQLKQNIKVLNNSTYINP